MSLLINPADSLSLESKPKKMPPSGRNRLFALMLTASIPGMAAANVAGTVEFAHGNTQLVSADGNRESLRKGMTVSANDTIETGSRGIVQLRLTDGGYISIDKNSTFRIDEYAFHPSSSNDAPRPVNKGFFSLLSGAFRTITGFLGTSNYRVKTPVATIGIRGTEYYAEMGTSLRFNVADGAIEVCNTGGCQFFRESEFGQIADNASLIRRLRDMGLDIVVSEAKGETIATVEGSDGFEFRISEEVDDDGDPVVLDEESRTLACSNGNCTAAFGFTFDNSNLEIVQDISATFDGTALVSHDGGTNSSPDAVGTTTAEAAGATTDIAWGRWTNGESSAGNSALHYVIGVPTPNFNTLTGALHYSVSGWTRPTYGDSDANYSNALGAFNSIRGDLNADFSNSIVDLNFSADFANADYHVQESISISRGGTFTKSSVFATGGLPVSGDGGFTCDSTCYAKFQGFFAGVDANSAGLSYIIEDLYGAGEFIGAAVYDADGPGSVSVQEQ